MGSSQVLCGIKEMDVLLWNTPLCVALVGYMSKHGLWYC